MHLLVIAEISAGIFAWRLVVRWHDIEAMDFPTVDSVQHRFTLGSTGQKDAHGAGVQLVHAVQE